MIRRLFGGTGPHLLRTLDLQIRRGGATGAAGALLIHTDESATYPWQVVQSSWTGTQYSLPPQPGAPGSAIKAWMTNAAARDLAKRGGQDLDALRTAAEKRGFKAVPLNDSRGRDADAAIGAQDRAQRRSAS